MGPNNESNRMCSGGEEKIKTILTEAHREGIIYASVRLCACVCMYVFTVNRQETTDDRQTRQ